LPCPIHHPPPKYFIDSVFEEKHHKTIRLFLYKCDLTTVELIWNTLKTRAVQKKLLKVLPKLKIVQLRLLRTKIREDEKNIVSHVKKRESSLLGKV
jgi:hypothetical protein